MGFYNSGHILSASSGAAEFDTHSKLFNNLRKSNFLPSFSFSFSHFLSHKNSFSYVGSSEGNEPKTSLGHQGLFLVVPLNSI